ncbi:MAG TPA: HU family DNA-binding protein [Blastocatellia bacterium]
MTKAELVEEVARAAELNKRDAEVIVETVFDSIISTLHKGEKVELRGFGSFRTRERGPRRGRNPKTGQPVDVPAKRVPYFKPGKELKEYFTEGDESGASGSNDDSDGESGAEYDGNESALAASAHGTPPPSPAPESEPAVAEPSPEQASAASENHPPQTSEVHQDVPAQHAAAAAPDDGHTHGTDGDEHSSGSAG